MNQHFRTCKIDVRSHQRKKKHRQTQHDHSTNNAILLCVSTSHCSRQFRCRKLAFHSTSKSCKLWKSVHRLMFDGRLLSDCVSVQDVGIPLWAAIVIGKINQQSINFHRSVLNNLCTTRRCRISVVGMGDVLVSLHVVPCLPRASTVIIEIRSSSTDVLICRNIDCRGIGKDIISVNIKTISKCLENNRQSDKLKRHRDCERPIDAVRCSQTNSTFFSLFFFFFFCAI